MSELEVITGLGATAGAVIVVFMFLKDRAEERKLFLADRQSDRTLWQNHLSHTVIVLQELVDEVREHRKWTDGKP